MHCSHLLELGNGQFMETDDRDDLLGSAGVGDRIVNL